MTPEEQANQIVDRLPQTVFRPDGLRLLLIAEIAAALRDREVPEGEIVAQCCDDVRAACTQCENGHTSRDEHLDAECEYCGRSIRAMRDAFAAREATRAAAESARSGGSQ